MPRNSPSKTTSKISTEGSQTRSIDSRPGRAIGPAKGCAILSLIALFAGLLQSVAFAADAGTGPGVSPDDLHNAFGFASSAWQSIQEAPAGVYFGLMSIALLFPVPASAFYLAAGPIYGVGQALLWIAGALAANALFVHAIGSSLLRPWIESRLKRSGRPMPRMTSSSNQWLFILLVRITPGVPYFIQNWVLALAEVRLLPFLILSVSIQMIYAAGFVILGRSAFEGRLGLGLIALFLLILASILARWAHLRLNSEQAIEESEVS